jgi:hypothetical protein
MPGFIINTSEEDNNVVFTGSTNIAADLGVAQGLHSRISCSTTVVAQPNEKIKTGATSSGLTSLSVFLRLHGEPNILLQALIEGSMDFEAGLATGFGPYGRFDGNTAISANLRISTAETSELAMVVDIVPDALGAPGRYVSRWLPRLKIDGVEVPVIEWTFTESPNTAGGDLHVVLARPQDRSLFTSTALIEFAIGRKIRSMGSIVWDEATMYVFMEGSSVKGFTSSVGWANNAPTDAVSVNGSSSLEDRLGLTPATDVIIYDSTRQTLTLDSFDPIIDTEGRFYFPTLTPVANLTLYDIFQKVLVEKCGFSFYQTNIPDFPLNRVDLKMGQGYLDSIKGYFGMFEPVIFPVDDGIWLVDTTTVLPSGFPSPRQVGVSEYRTLSLTKAQSRLDALLVEYVEQRLDYDYITSGTETKTEDTGEFGTPNYTSTFIQRLYREYRKFSHPGVIIRKELYHEDRTTTGPFGIGEIFSAVENYTYDSQNRLTEREKTESALFPFLDDPHHSLVMQECWKETETLTYAVHPYLPRSNYMQRREILTEGLITIDSENQQLGKDFERDFSTAYRSGNLVESMTTRFGAIKSRTETFEPLRDGSVRVTTKEVDALANSVVEDTREEKIGDIAINGLSPQQLRMLVFDDESTTRATGLVQTVHFGELPVNILVPLARRVLRTRKRKGQTISCDVVGFDPVLRRGMTINALGRLGASVGNFIILGRQVKGDHTGCETSLSCREV